VVEDKNIGVSTQDGMTMTSLPESIASDQQEGLASEKVTKEPLPAPITKSPIHSKIVDLDNGKESPTVNAYEDIALPAPIALPDKEPIHIEPSRTQVLKGLSTAVKEIGVANWSKLNKPESSF